MSEKISIQQMLQRLGDLIGPMKRAELCALLTELAKAQPVDERAAFLEQLQSLACGTADTNRTAATTEETVLEALERIRQEAEERQGIIEDGNYDELDDWDEDSEYGWYNQPDALTDGHQQEIQAFEKKANDLFLDQNYAAAVEIYRPLIELAGHLRQEFFANVLTDAATVGRNYCRAVFELARKNKRAESLFDAISLAAKNLDFRGNIEGENGLCLLKDVFAGSPVLKQPEFLDEWERFLSAKTEELAAVLTVETLLLRNRRTEPRIWLEASGHENASAWLLYLHEMDQAGEWKELSIACRQVLNFMNDAARREVVSALLQKAGVKRKDASDIAEGLRNRFMVRPSLWLLSQLVKQLPDPALQRKELLKYDDKLAGKNVDAVRVAVRLLLGDPEHAFSMTRLDFSFDKSPCYVAACGALIALCNSTKPLPVEVRSMADRYLMPNDSWPQPSITELGTAHTTLLQAVRNRLAETPLTPEKKKILLTRTKNVVMTGLETILSSKHRGSYDRAAEGVAAWAAAAKQNGQADEADELIRKILDQYNRFSSFKKELKARIQTI